MFIHNEQTKEFPIPIPLPDVGPLNPPLGLLAPLPTKFRSLPETAKYSAVQAVVGLAERPAAPTPSPGPAASTSPRFGRC